MRNKLIVIAVAITMVTMVFPASQARHLSAGVRDSPGAAPQEDRNNPSVAGDEGDIGKNDTPYGVGTTDPDECFQRTSVINASNAQEAATKDGFCGRLVYNHGSSDLKVLSPPDQDYNFPGGEVQLDDRKVTGFDRFDVVRTWGVGLGPGCEPFCDSTGQNTTWNLTHKAGDALQITDPPEKADKDENSERDQYMVGRIDHVSPNAVFAAAGPWAMNGWTVPAYYGSSFVGFLYDNTGQVVSDNDLKTIVEELKTRDGGLGPDAVAGVCGFTPDRSYQSTGEQVLCEDKMNFVNVSANPSAGSPPEFTSYEDECGSPAYICGPSGEQGYWESSALGLLDAYAARYQGEFMRWHYVVAPTPQTCGNAEPGFNPDPAAGTDYLAHDLDVYVPAHHFQTGGTPVSTSNTIDYAETVAYQRAANPEEVVAGATPGSGILPPTIDSLADEATAQNVRESLTEPNLGDSGTSDLDDTSQSFYLERTQTDCGSLTLDTGHHSPPQHPEEQLDPWTNILDAGVDGNREASYRDPVVDSRTPPELGRDTPTVGLFGNSQADGQDADNDPTPGRYTPVGSVGMFMDGDDDGQYERVTGPADSASLFGAGVYDQTNIQGVGGYPMLWDMHVKENKDGAIVPAPDEGCTADSVKGEQFTEWMVDTGYGANTSLVQAIYLRGPTEFTTVFDNDGNPDPASAQYIAGDNIYLLMNQAGHELWGGNSSADLTTTDNPVDGKIDQLLADLVDYLDNEQDLNVANTEIRVPNDDAVGNTGNLDSDFTGQCDQSTGDFTSQWSFTHQCAAADHLCKGDTIATMYTFEVTSEDGTLGGENVPPLVLDPERTDTNSEGAYNFESNSTTWYDVDPFDGDPSRNDETRANAPSGWCPEKCG